MAYAAAGVGAYYILLLALTCIGKKQKYISTELSEVVYRYKTIKQNNSCIAVYEWDDDIQAIKEELYYNNSKEKPNEGDILYKINTKTGYAFIAKI